MSNITYREEKTREYINKYNEVLKELPLFCEEYFIGIEHRTQARTRYAYAVDILSFFEYIGENHRELKTDDIKSYGKDILDKISITDIERYLHHLLLYEKDGKEITNSPVGVRRKLSSIRSFYTYYFKKDEIKTNPAVKVPSPKVKEKNIIRLEGDEASDLIDSIEYDKKMSKMETAYNKKNKTRDIAIITLMLGTGIRVSECVGLNLADVDMKRNKIIVVRKGGKEQEINFNNTVRENLEFYLEERKKMITKDGHEDALFLSGRMQRISVRSVECIVKKHSRRAISSKRITPHKLRSTYGTNLYQQTGDLYLVAHQLGHSDVNTSKIYAEQDDKYVRSKINDFNIYGNDEQTSN